jgi:hypothetical protein
MEMRIAADGRPAGSTAGGERRTNNSFRLDMTMMYAFHDALRRDLDRIANVSARTDGWALFDRLLHVHHTVEDEALWPVVREMLDGRPDEVALLDEMEAEHAVLPPLLEAVDAALGRGESAPETCAELAANLQEHLVHEEEAALPLIDATLTEEQWMAFGAASTEKLGPDMPHFLAWLLDGVTPDRAASILGILPEPVQTTYRDEWEPAYAVKDWWAT